MVKTSFNQLVIVKNLLQIIVSLFVVLISFDLFNILMVFSAGCFIFYVHSDDSLPLVASVKRTN